MKENSQTTQEQKVQNCGNENCACSSKENLKSTQTKNLNPETKSSSNQDSNSEPEQDPTRFGDWQVNGRAIDF